MSSHYFSPTSPHNSSQYKTGEEDSGFESLVTTNSDSGSSSSHQVGWHTNMDKQIWTITWNSRCPFLLEDLQDPTWCHQGSIGEVKAHYPPSKVKVKGLFPPTRTSEVQDQPLFGQFGHSRSNEIHLICTNWLTNFIIEAASLGLPNTFGQ